MSRRIFFFWYFFFYLSFFLFSCNPIEVNSNQFNSKSPPPHFLLFFFFFHSSVPLVLFSLLQTPSLPFPPSTLIHVISFHILYSSLQNQSQRKPILYTLLDSFSSLLFFLFYFRPFFWFLDFRGDSKKKTGKTRPSLSFSSSLS